MDRGLVRFAATLGVAAVVFGAGVVTGKQTTKVELGKNLLARTFVVDGQSPSCTVDGQGGWRPLSDPLINGHPEAIITATYQGTDPDFGTEPVVIYAAPGSGDCPAGTWVVVGRGVMNIIGVIP